MSNFFEGKTAVVTGGSGVLCSCFCRALAERGARVAVVGTRLETAGAVSDEISSSGGIAMPVACNVQDINSVREAEKQICDAFGPADILINGAGIAPASACTTKERADEQSLAASPEEERTLFNLPSEVFREVMDLNCIGMFNVTQVFSQKMAGIEGANILNISSMSGISPLTKQIAYSASKAAVTNLTQWLSIHLAGVGIRVNAIAPGFFLTRINRHLLLNEDGSNSPRAQKIIDGTPMNRMGSPDELTGAMLYLCDSSASSFVTGVILPVDGGFSAYCGV